MVVHLTNWYLCTSHLGQRIFCQHVHGSAPRESVRTEYQTEFQSVARVLRTLLRKVCICMGAHALAASTSQTAVGEMQSESLIGKRLGCRTRINACSLEPFMYAWSGWWAAAQNAQSIGQHDTDYKRINALYCVNRITHTECIFENIMPKPGIPKTLHWQKYICMNVKRRFILCY